MATLRLCILIIGYFAASSLGQYDLSFDYGDYCRNGRGGSKLCCIGRHDNCSLPRGYGVYRTLCYCDSFCERTHPRPHLPDCCPDYEQVCLGRPAPTPAPERQCYYNGFYYKAGTEFKDNCKSCQCIDRGHNMEVRCTQGKCLVDMDLVNNINRGRRGWVAGNITYFWGVELRTGYEGMLGTEYSSKKVRDLSSISNTTTKRQLPLSFDWRTRLGFVTPIENQNFCNSSWSYAIVSTFSDRLTIWTGGNFSGPLSYQQHRTCVLGQKRGPCQSGHLTRSWKYLINTGLTTERCLPQENNFRCTLRRTPDKKHAYCVYGGTERLYKISRTSRISGEAQTMNEIKDKGPVVATMRVFDDFFVYKGGVYECPTTAHKRGYLHSVRLIGWGEEYINGRLTPYWIAANSWGTEWGENGFFRIRRGINDCAIEEFVLQFYLSSKRMKRDASGNFVLDFSDDEVTL